MLMLSVYLPVQVGNGVYIRHEAHIKGIVFPRCINFFFQCYPGHIFMKVLIECHHNFFYDLKISLLRFLKASIAPRYSQVLAPALLAW